MTAAEEAGCGQVRVTGASPKGDPMTTAVIGATGRVGSEIVRGVPARGESATALIRDPDKARRSFGEPDGRHFRC